MMHCKISIEENFKAQEGEASDSQEKQESRRRGERRRKRLIILNILLANRDHPIGRSGAAVPKVSEFFIFTASMHI